MTKKPNRKDNSKQREMDAKPINSCHNEQKVSEVVAKSQSFPYRLVTISHWTVPCQIGSLAVFDVATTRHLLASYPGGTYAILTSFDLNCQKLPSEQVGKIV